MRMGEDNSFGPERKHEKCSFESQRRETFEDCDDKLLGSATIAPRLWRKAADVGRAAALDLSC
jgi:hypothetical protein